MKKELKKTIPRYNAGGNKDFLHRGLSVYSSIKDDQEFSSRTEQKLDFLEDLICKKHNMNHETFQNNYNVFREITELEKTVPNYKIKGNKVSLHEDLSLYFSICTDERISPAMIKRELNLLEVRACKEYDISYGEFLRSYSIFKSNLKTQPQQSL